MYRSSPITPDRLAAVLRKILPEHDRIFHRGEIPPRRLETVVVTYDLPDPESVLCVYDDTVFGSAEDGFVVTAEHFGFKGFGAGPVLLELRRLRHDDIEMCEGCLYVKRGRVDVCAGADNPAILDGIHRSLLGLLDLMSQAAPAPPEPGPPSTEAELQRLLERELPAHGDLHWRGRIPKRKLHTVCRVYPIESRSDVLLLYDDTVFGSAEEGFLFTASHFGFKAISGPPIWLALGRLEPEHIEQSDGQLRVKGRQVEIINDSATAEIRDSLQRVLERIARLSR